MNKTIQQYVKSLQAPITRHYFDVDGPYYGKAGAQRFGREVGFGLGDYSDAEVNDIMPALYSILVIQPIVGGKLQVEISNEEFLDSVRKGLQKRKARNDEQ